MSKSERCEECGGRLRFIGSVWVCPSCSANKIVEEDNLSSTYPERGSR